MQPAANMTTQNLIKINLYQTFLRSAGMRTKIFLLMLFSIFHEKVTDCVRSNVPLRKLSRKQLSLQSKPWISVRIKNIIAKRNKYLRRFYKTHSLDMEYLYKKFTNKVVTEIRKSKNDYYADYFTKHKTNMKMLWSSIRSIVNSTINVGSDISSLIHNGAKMEDSKKMANIFNNVFVNTAHKINEKIPRTRKSP